MDKNKKRRFLRVGIGVIAAIGLLAFAFVGLQALAVSDSGGEVGIDGKVEGREGEMTIAASAVTNSINYQGRLTDSAGNPLSGTYIMTFSLYDVASWGTALDTDTHSVEVTDGLFNTEIDFAHGYFDGRALWLGITVGSDAEMTPRQEFRPVPYALSLVPGARIVGNTTDPALRIENVGDGVWAYTTGDYSEGVFARTYGDHSQGVFARTDGNYSEGVFAHTTGYESEGVYAYTTGYGSPAVVGFSGRSFGVYGIGEKGGGYFGTSTAGSSDNPLAGVNVSTAYNYNPGVRIETDGLDSDGVYARTYGDHSEGVYARTYGDHSEGVYARTDGDYSKGVLAHTYGNYSKGVYVSTSGDSSDGVWVYTTGYGSDGVHAYSARGFAGYFEGKGYFSGNVGIGTASPGQKLTVRGNILVESESTGNPVVELGEGLDYAEGFDVSGDKKIGPGSVLIIDPDNPGKLALSNTPYDSKVAGIVTGANGMGSGVRLGSDQFDYDVALAGRVYCNVDATEAGVEPGDLLTTSATPGYAMKAIDYERAQGAILGKAMQRLEKGEKGQILVLVTLQ